MPVELCWNNVAHSIEKPVATESREERIAWSDECMLTYTDELFSPDFKLFVLKAISALSTSVDKSTDCIVHALYRAAACTIKTVGNKKKRINGWFDQECMQMKKSVKRQLRKSRRTNNHGEREKYVKYRKE